jgi:hypothetical protein
MCARCAACSGSVHALVPRMSSQPTDPVHRGGHAPAPEVRERPEQNIGYDEAVKGEPLTDDERQEAIADSPLTDDEDVDEDAEDDSKPS